MTAETKPVIGLTGGIASGKSAVARILLQVPVPVIDADAIAREVVVRGKPALAEIVATFGKEVLAEDGSLAREKLGALVFQDDKARAKLNAILHPRIGRLSAERIAAAQESASPYVVYEAPLLVETGAYRGLAALIVVAAEPATQIARVQSRDGLSAEEARARIAAQLPLAEKIAVADYVIPNDADLDSLRARTLDVHRQILTRFGLT